MTRNCAATIALLCSVLGGAGCQAEEMEQDLSTALLGTWTYDLEYIGEYLRKGAEIQETWCGYGWPESEIERREKFLLDDAEKNGPPLVWNFQQLNGDIIELTITNNKNESQLKQISDCVRRQDDMFACRQVKPSSDEPLVLRFDDQYLLVMIRMTPDVMNCDVKQNTPAEVWISPIRFKRVEAQ